jgi:hypothetical protein
LISASACSAMFTESVRMYVISPTWPSPGIVKPSYRRWAICMVFRAENPSFRAASCWSVDVVNGGAGVRLTSRWRTSRTL